MITSILSPSEKVYADRIATMFQNDRVDPKIAIPLLRKIADDMELVHKHWLNR